MARAPEWDATATVATNTTSEASTTGTIFEPSLRFDTARLCDAVT